MLFGFARAAGGRHENLEFRCIGRILESRCFYGSMLSHVCEGDSLMSFVTLDFGLRVFMGSDLSCIYGMVFTRVFKLGL
ncbi:hypothetical protein D3C84_1217510 [compost metagenome]